MSVLLTKLGLPILLKTVSSALKKVTNPLAKTAAQALDNLDEAVLRGEVKGDDLIEANRHIEAMARLEQEELKTLITEINQSLRAEVASSDPYVRRMRPTFGYIMAVTWAAQMLAVAFTILDNPAQAGEVINAMASLSAIWTVGLSVLGIYVYKRSQEKQRGV